MFSRREILKTSSCGFGYLALSGLFGQAARAATSEQHPLAAKKPHFTPRAKRVIFMFMQGGPSHVDTFDYKPALERDDGKTPTDTGGKANRKLMKSPWKFSPSGQSGLMISELFPNVAKHADDLCLLNGMATDLPNHPQAAVQLHTGSFQFVRPSMGAWILYGLGTENQELPGFITINPITRVGGAVNFGSSFLPAPFQGTPIGGEGQSLANAVIPNIANRELTRDQQRKQLDLLQSISRDRLSQDKVNGELEGVIESYELAFRMQTARPKIMDFKEESPSTLESYGIAGGASDNFGRQCLIARRFAEAGVRFIELGQSGWDHHNQLRTRLAA